MIHRTLSILDEMDLGRRRFLKVVASGVAGIYSGLLLPTQAKSSLKGHTLTIGRLLMGTVVEGEANHPDLSIARRAVEVSLERMVEVDRLMSTFRPDSEISRANRLATEHPVQVGEATFGVLQEAQRIARMSHGAFDVTIHPLMELWRSTTREGRIPSRKEREATLASVAHADLSLDSAHRLVRFRRPGMGVDLSGIAKGYAVDAAAEALKEYGVNSGLIDAGGDLRVIGLNRQGGSWRVGLRHPLAPSRLLLSILVEDEAVATSGNYFRYFTVADRRYGHLLRPLTGTAADAPLSATVIARSAMRADGLATAAMLHREGAFAFINQVSEIEGIVISQQTRHPGKVSVQVTSGLKRRVELLDRSAELER